MKNNYLSSQLDKMVLTASPETEVGILLQQIKDVKYNEDLPVFVLDKNRRLTGFVPLVILIRSDSSTRLLSVLSKCTALHHHKSKEFAVNFAISNKLNFVPVENDKGEFIGAFSTQEVIETLRREHIEDLHKIAGIKKEMVSASQAISEPPIRSVWHRLPWLLAGLFGSFFATYIMASFEATLSQNISLAFFIPGIVYLADAIGTQTETIVIRGISLSWTSLKKTFVRELLTGLLIGVILGSISFCAALIVGYEFKISLVVFLSIITAGAIATSIGLLLPSLLNKMGKDPAFGSGPLATVIQDVLSILIYLAISVLIFKLF